MIDSPFTMLKALEQNSITCARPLPKLERVEEYWHGIGFKALETYFVIALTEVSEVLRNSKLTKVPGIVKWLLGIANLRGKLLPVVDLQGFIMGENSFQTTNTQQILVFNHKEALHGLLIEKIIGLQKIAYQYHKTDINELNPLYQPFIQGKFTTPDQHWLILDSKKIIENDKFYKVIAG